MVPSSLPRLEIGSPCEHGWTQTYTYKLKVRWLARETRLLVLRSFAQDGSLHSGREAYLPDQVNLGAAAPFRPQGHLGGAAATYPSLRYAADAKRRAPSRPRHFGPKAHGF